MISKRPRDQSLLTCGESRSEAVQPELPGINGFDAGAAMTIQRLYHRQPNRNVADQVIHKQLIQPFRKRGEYRILRKWLIWKGYSPKMC